LHGRLCNNNPGLGGGKITGGYAGESIGRLRFFDGFEPSRNEALPAGGYRPGVGEVGSGALDIGFCFFEAGTGLGDRRLGDRYLRLDVAGIEPGDHLTRSHPVALIGIERGQHPGDLEANVRLDPCADRAKPEHLLPHIGLHGRNRDGDRREERGPGKERGDGDHGG
jgi:hypothetical protein